MDVAHSPHREPGGTMHFPSPTHPHGYRLDGAAHFSNFQQLRHTLSRSPSKPSRFHLRTGKPDSPTTPLSPLALARALSPRPHKPSSPIATHPESPLSSQTAPPTAKKKLSMRRPAPFRSSPRTRNNTSTQNRSPRRTSPRRTSPRRALVDSTNPGNSTPQMARYGRGQENTPIRKSSADFFSDVESEGNQQLNDEPIKFKIAQGRPDSSAPGANVLQAPVKSSPLKRSDANTDFDADNRISPAAKRRSLHGSSSFGSDFDIFNCQTPAPRSSVDEIQQSPPNEPGNKFSFTPISNIETPLRRTTSLRKSAFPPRAPKSKPAYDGEFVLPGPAASKTGQRYSLDGAVGMGSSVAQSPMPPSKRSLPMDHGMRASLGPQQRHPLSNALTPSASSTNLVENAPALGPPPTPGPRNTYTKSLPIGAARPTFPPGDDGFGTPFAAQRHPTAASTGLLSKKNRDAESPRQYIMPGTPTKRNSFPPALTDQSPIVKRSSGGLFGKSMQSQPEFGTPSTPFGTNVSKFSTESLGKGVEVFGSVGGLQRRASFASIDGEDHDTSPTVNRMTDSQSSADDMPPTPTKPHDGSSRRSKESSLRRKTFRAGRTSLGEDTFTKPSDDVSDASNFQPQLSLGPQTPTVESVVPDPSSLSISGQRRTSVPFGVSGMSPMTPTTPRDHNVFGCKNNDVDENLTSRFHEVKPLDGAKGEFSEVFKVSRPVRSRSIFSSPPGSQVFVVKKSKKPSFGSSDRGRRMREVEVLLGVRGNEHVVQIIDHWEDLEQGHLYIQTEYCEGGNLSRFLGDAGYHDRLDDFRIWKILLELTEGLAFIHERGYIHLDLKPANILIDFEGVLKIADFGIASKWPAPKGIEGEGDRHYLAPEAMHGYFDKPADVFAIGMMLMEIATNSDVPEFGESWQILRSGKLGSLPSLTWSAHSSTLSRHSDGQPIRDATENGLELDLDAGPQYIIGTHEDASGLFHIRSAKNPHEEIGKAPRFMIDGNDPNAMDQVAKAMMRPDPVLRPTAEQVNRCFGCQWVAQRRRAGATIYEGNFGPGDHVLAYDQHLDDMMDTS